MWNDTHFTLNSGIEKEIKMTNVGLFPQGGSKTSTMITSTPTRDAVLSSLFPACSSSLPWASTIVCWTKRRRRKRGGLRWRAGDMSPIKAKRGQRWQKIPSNLCIPYWVTYFFPCIFFFARITTNNNWLLSFYFCTVWHSMVYIQY